MKYIVIYEKNENGYSAYLPDLPGCIAVGDIPKETEDLIYEAIVFHIEGLIEEGLPIPEITTTKAETLVFS